MRATMAGKDFDDIDPEFDDDLPDTWGGADVQMVHTMASRGKTGLGSSGGTASVVNTRLFRVYRSTSSNADRT